MVQSVAEAECGTTFSAAHDVSTPTVIFLDLTMPGTDGIELLRDLAKTEFSGSVILVSGRMSGFSAQPSGSIECSDWICQLH